jgi:hypothetical protein
MEYSNPLHTTVVSSFVFEVFSVLQFCPVLPTTVFVCMYLQFLIYVCIAKTLGSAKALCCAASGSHFQGGRTVMATKLSFVAYGLQLCCMCCDGFLSFMANVIGLNYIFSCIN